MLNLGEALKRGLEITLVILDEALCEFEQWAHGREQRGVFYSERNTLSPRQRQQILLEVAGMREVLRELQNDLALAGRTCQAANHIWGKCAVLAVNLEEIQGRHLAGYGKAPPELADYLNRRLKRLKVSLDQIFRLAAESRS